MRRRLYPQIILLSMLVLGSALLSQPAGASTAPAAGVARTLEPVVLTGAQLATLAGAPVDDLFVYVNRAGAWSQVPFQVDEIGANGRFTSAGDGAFDAVDELAFMAKDLGDQAAMSGDAPAGLPGTGAWYQVEVSDPLDATAKGYAYVVRSASLTSAFTGAYVSYDAANRRIIGDAYQMGFSLSPPNAGAAPEPNIWFDYLSLGGSADILDRSPKFLGCLGAICLREQALFGLSPREGLNLVKSGPVRLIFRSSAAGIVTNDILAYENMTAWSTKAILSAFAPTLLSLTTDFNPAASGAKFYNGVTQPAGVTIDGNPDTTPPDNVPAQPFSPWYQVSANQGTLVHASDPTPVGGTPRNYYEDNSTPCSPQPCDTGDQQRWGESGIIVQNPNQTFTYRFNFYYLQGQQPNVGSTYAQYFAQPLSATLEDADRGVKVYLPLVKK